ncbi:MAG: radical SAM protein, partial [Bacteroidota bacterium]
KDMMAFLAALSKIDGLQKINITTNGTLTAKLIPELKALGIDTINLSIDSLDKDRFYKITRRNVFDQVMETYHALLDHGINTKLNAVVMEGQNIEDIIPMVELGRHHPVSVRFIEEMPFNGEGNHYPVLVWNHKKIKAHLQASYPDLEKLPDPPNSTAQHYRVPGFKGDVGIIAAYSRTFCGSCNRIRITPQGMLKTCLYDNGVFNIRDLMRAGADDQQIIDTFKVALGNRAKDGWEAEKNRGFDLPVKESMATIGG